MRSGEKSTPPPEPVLEEHKAKVGTLEEWIKEQPLSLAEEKSIDKSRVRRDDGGLTWYEGDDGI